jgi:hypothetical protein
MPEVSWRLTDRAPEMLESMCKSFMGYPGGRWVFQAKDGDYEQNEAGNILFVTL